MLRTFWYASHGVLIRLHLTRMRMQSATRHQHALPCYQHALPRHHCGGSRQSMLIARQSMFIILGAADSASGDVNTNMPLRNNAAQSPCRSQRQNKTLNPAIFNPKPYTQDNRHVGVSGNLVLLRHVRPHGDSWKCQRPCPLQVPDLSKISSENKIVM